MYKLANKTGASPSAVAGKAVVAKPRTLVVSCATTSEDAIKAQRAQEALAKALAMNELLKKQVVAEGQRATQAARELAKVQAQVNANDKRMGLAPRPASAPASAPAAAAGPAQSQVVAALEAEKRRAQQIISESAKMLEQIEAERKARATAEATVKELESKLRDTTSRLQQQSMMYKEAEQAIKSTDSSQEALEKVLAMNELLKKQVQGEILRVSQAKDLAAARQRELAETAAKLRQEEKMLAKLTKDAQLATKQADGAKEELAAAQAANEALQKQVQAEAERAAKAEQEAIALKKSLEGTQTRIIAEESNLNEVLGEAKEARAIRAALEEALATNEVLKRQVAAEGQRALRASRDLAQVQTAGREAEKLRDAVAAERKDREAAQRQYQEAARALEAEKRKAATLKTESGSAPQLVEAERVARLAAEARIKELEAKIAETNKQLEQQAVRFANAQKAVNHSERAQEALEKALATIEILKKQVSGETARVSQAKDLAAARQKELQAVAAKLREEQMKLKMINRDATRAVEQAKKDREALLAATAANDELQKQAQAESQRATQALAQVSSLKELLDQARSQIKTEETKLKAVTADAQKISNAQAALQQALATNEILKKQVLGEGARAARAAKELAEVQGRVKEMETALEAVQSEANSMKSAVAGFLQQMKDILDSRTEREIEKAAKLEELTKQLNRSQRQEAEARHEASELRQALEVAKSRVMLLQLEMSQQKKEVVAAKPQKRYF